MAGNYTRVAELLDEASKLLKEPTSSSTTTATLSTTLSNARNMLSTSSRNGVFARLSSNERLRATTSTSSPTSSSSRGRGMSNFYVNRRQQGNKRKNSEKPIEFALLRPDDDEDDENHNKTTLKWDSVISNGIVMVCESDGESAIRSKIKRAVSKSFPLIGENDFEFVKVRRKEVTKINLDSGMEYSYHVVKKMAGQGLLYAQVKKMFRGLVDDKFDGEGDDNDDDGLLLFKQETVEDDAKTAESPAQQHGHGAASTELIEDKKKDSEIHDVVHIDISEDGEPETKKTKLSYTPPDGVLKAVSDVQEKNICDPVEILRFFQQALHRGRILDMKSLDVGEDDFEGEVNYLSVDRDNILYSTFQELEDSVKDYFLTYEIDFYGELAKDLGGPRREWLRLCCLDIKSKYFDNGLKEHLASDYYYAGIILSTSLFQGGPTPKFISNEIIESLIESSISESKCIQELRNGMNKLGMIYILQSFPQMKHLFLLDSKNSQPTLSVKRILQMLQPEFADPGSFKLMKQKEIYNLFVKYVREVASGRRVINLSNILEFVTGATEEPLLGFSIKPSIKFVELPVVDEVSSHAEDKENENDDRNEENNESKVGAELDLKKKVHSFIPKCHTCGNVLQLPIGDLNNHVPAKEELFSIYDMAFINAHFGLV